MSELISWWGAAVATGLGALRAYEFWRDRQPRLQTSYIWRGLADVGNDLLLINDSKVPASIYLLELVWARPRRFRRPIQQLSIFDNEDEFFQMTIPPHSTEKINFREELHFPVRAPKGCEACKLFAKIWLVGRKGPLWVQVNA